jgi:hypothetical protein
MAINRRSVLTGTAGLLLAGPAFGLASGPRTAQANHAGRWHPVTASLLDRARQMEQPSTMIDRRAVDGALRNMARLAGGDKTLVINWLGSPAGALDYLDGFGLDTLMSMTNDNFWSVPGSMKPFDEDAFDHAGDARSLAADILRVEEQDRALTSPKLAAKAVAIAAGASAPELFAVRAKLAQIGWLETSWAAAAAEAVFEVEYALCRGEPEGSGSIHRQLMVFEAYEIGLLATWETPTGLICVPRLI